MALRRILTAVVVLVGLAFLLGVLAAKGATE